MSAGPEVWRPASRMMARSGNSEIRVGVQRIETKTRCLLLMLRSVKHFSLFHHIVEMLENPQPVLCWNEGMHQTIERVWNCVCSTAYTSGTASWHHVCGQILSLANFFDHIFSDKKWLRQHQTLMFLRSLAYFRCDSLFITSERAFERARFTNKLFPDPTSHSLDALQKKDVEGIDTNWMWNWQWCWQTVSKLLYGGFVL